MRKIFALSILLGAALFHDSTAQACPAAIPQPANATDVQCFTINKPVNVRCATAVSQAVCDFLNNKARTLGLVTQDGYDYLYSIGFCAMVNNYGEGEKIYDFCPVGCLAADTKLLSGESGLTLASDVTPQSRLMSMTSEATLGEVALSPQSVKRVVYGPEDLDLFVFSLASGSTLRVTAHHPMVLDNGKIVEAASVDASMSFVGGDGRPVAITGISREKAVGDVFNFEMSGDSQLNHIIVAEGVLVGDLKLQRELADESGSIELRR